MASYILSVLSSLLQNLTWHNSSQEGGESDPDRSHMEANTENTWWKAHTHIHTATPLLSGALSSCWDFQVNNTTGDLGADAVD